MAEPDQRANLAGEPIKKLRARGSLILGHGKLQNDVGVQVAIVREKNMAHASLADAPQDPKPPLGDLQPDPLAAAAGHGVAPCTDTRSARRHQRAPHADIAPEPSGGLMKDS